LYRLPLRKAMLACPYLAAIDLGHSCLIMANFCSPPAPPFLLALLPERRKSGKCFCSNPKSPVAVGSLEELKMKKKGKDDTDLRYSCLSSSPIPSLSHFLAGGKLVRDRGTSAAAARSLLEACTAN